MKYFYVLLSVLIFIGCSTTPKAEKEPVVLEVKKRGPRVAPKPVVPEERVYDNVDSSVRKQVMILDSIYGTTPYYLSLNDDKFFIVMNGKIQENYYSERFIGRYQYGITDSGLKLILPCNYDKIYNPNLTIINCMEIKKDSLIGLFNYKTKEIVTPEFEYIMPSSQKANEIAYGFKHGSWYKIESLEKFKISKSTFVPVNLLSTLSFNALTIRKNLLYDLSTLDEPAYGRGVVITPSYIERLGLMPEACTDFLSPDQDGMGTMELNIKTDTVKSITDKLIAFVVSFYTKGVDARYFLEDSKQVVVYNKETEAFTKEKLNYMYDDYNNHCDRQSNRFISDTIIEFTDDHQNDTIHSRRYDFQAFYHYIAINKKGEVRKLTSNRYYISTKYVVMDESYFKGCFAKYIGEDEAEKDNDNNVWISEHLSMDDLDVMINEIYADYGFKFKTEKWRNYFSQFKWYKPQYDNVDNLLTEIDKKNIELIAAEKAKMKGMENEFTKRHKGAFHFAG